MLHVISFVNLKLRICCACKDSTQNFSKIQDKIPTASCCWKSEKLGFPDLVTTPCKNCKNQDRSKGDLENLKNHIILTKEVVNGDEKFDYNCTSHRET